MAQEKDNPVNCAAFGEDPRALERPDSYLQGADCAMGSNTVDVEAHLPSDKKP